MLDKQMIVFVILLPIMAIMALSQYIRYNNTEKIAGEIITEINMTSKQRIFSFISQFIVVFLILYLFPQIRGMSRHASLGGVMYFLISVIGALMFAWAYNRKQKICTRGILNSQGLFLWNNIRKVKISDKESDVILVFLHEPVSKENCIKIKCDSEQIEYYIRIMENQIQQDYMMQ